MTLASAAARPHPARLLPTTYPVRGTVDARYGDMDANGHLNNLALEAMLRTLARRSMRRCFLGCTNWRRAGCGWSPPPTSCIFCANHIGPQRFRPASESVGSAARHTSPRPRCSSPTSASACATPCWSPWTTTDPHPSPMTLEPDLSRWYSVPSEVAVVRGRRAPCNLAPWQAVAVRSGNRLAAARSVCRRAPATWRRTPGEPLPSCSQSARRGQIGLLAALRQPGAAPPSEPASCSLSTRRHILRPAQPD